MHRRLKLAVAQSCRGSGWLAAPEVMGPGWRADVLATHEKLDRIVAFEIQTSTQTYARTKERQQGFAASGVQCAWLFTPFDSPLECKYQTPSAELPIFEVRPPVAAETDATASFHVLFSSQATFVSGRPSQLFSFARPQPLPSFVDNFLQGTACLEPCLHGCLHACV